MQTAKEFLNDEYQTILSSQTEANDYFLSCLNQSIVRIREDFDRVNQTQSKQMESKYKQLMQTIEEYASVDTSRDETRKNQQMDQEQLTDEHRAAGNELTKLNEHNRLLSERILDMVRQLWVNFAMSGSIRSRKPTCFAFVTIACVN